MKIYYHSDHLGSASFVTNRGGGVVQHLQYLPYGELFVSQRNSEEFDSRYKFTAKELDNETSYTYFGARYYDSDLSVWLSVDPMSDKYPSTSAYMYCVGNPIRLIDVNGEYWGDPLKKMKVRRNSVKNTFGPVRRNKNGTIKNHQGIDYYAPIGTPVYAINNGIVVKIVNEKQGSDYGTYIVIQHYDENGNPIVDENGKYEYSFYAHLSETSVTVGDNVVENETVIGKTGNTGNAENLKGEDEHLHFEIRTDIDLGKGLEGRKDPNKYVDTKFVIDSNDPTKVIMIENN